MGDHFALLHVYGLCQEGPVPVSRAAGVGGGGQTSDGSTSGWKLAGSRVTKHKLRLECSSCLLSVSHI